MGRSSLTMLEKSTSSAYPTPTTYLPVACASSVPNIGLRHYATNGNHLPSYERSDANGCMLVWGKNGKYRKTIQINKSANVFAFYLAPGYLNFHAFCAECKSMITPISKRHWYRMQRRLLTIQTTTTKFKRQHTIEKEKPSGSRMISVPTRKSSQCVRSLRPLTLT